MKEGRGGRPTCSGQQMGRMGASNPGQRAAGPAPVGSREVKGG